MTDVDALLGRADASLEGVTPGPWKTWRYDEAHPLAVTQDIEAENGARVVADMTNEEDPDDPEDAANARFIAESRSLVPELRDALKAERERVREYGTELNAIREFLERKTGVWFQEPSILEVVKQEWASLSETAEDELKLRVAAEKEVARLAALAPEEKA